MTAPTYHFIAVEPNADMSVVRIMLNRPRARNALSRGLLVELDEALLAAEEDDRVRVVIVGGEGPVFSAGHDLGSKESLMERAPGPDQHVSYRTHGGSRRGAEQRMLQEWHYYFQNTLRWRNLRKITIAEVHGSVYAAALMLAWSCDLIVAAEDTTFADVVGVRMGMCGVEYFAHPWEFGLRRTKELMLTGDSIEADEAHDVGMVSKVFPAAELRARTDAFAERIARTPTMAALLIKEAVNQTQDAMGFHNAVNACFSLHQLNHSHWAEIHDDKRAFATTDDGLPPWKEAPPIVPAEKTTVRAEKST